MAAPMRYDGKVALITGAGNGKIIFMVDKLIFCSIMKCKYCFFKDLTRSQVITLEVLGLVHHPNEY